MSAGTARFGSSTGSGRVMGSRDQTVVQRPRPPHAGWPFLEHTPGPGSRKRGRGTPGPKPCGRRPSWSRLPFMPDREFLANPRAIRQALREALAEAGSLDMAVAFVGKDWQDILGGFRGRVRLVCWLSSTNTNPYAVEDMLARRSFSVRQLDAMHAKGLPSAHSNRSRNRRLRKPVDERAERRRSKRSVRNSDACEASSYFQGDLRVVRGPLARRAPDCESRYRDRQSPLARVAPRSGSSRREDCCKARRPFTYLACFIQDSPDRGPCSHRGPHEPFS